MLASPHLDLDFQKPKFFQLQPIPCANQAMTESKSHLSLNVAFHVRPANFIIKGTPRLGLFSFFRQPRVKGCLEVSKLKPQPSDFQPDAMTTGEHKSIKSICIQIEKKQMKIDNTF